MMKHAIRTLLSPVQGLELRVCGLGLGFRDISRAITSGPLDVQDAMQGMLYETCIQDMLHTTCVQDMLHTTCCHSRTSGFRVRILQHRHTHSARNVARSSAPAPCTASTAYLFCHVGEHAVGYFREVLFDELMAFLLQNTHGC